MLPDSGTDYEASQGYVAYSVRLKNNLAVGTKLKNTANIYFDFNDPIITNTTVNTIILKSSAAITNLGKDMNISIYPNPTQDKALIKIALDKPSIVTFNLFDLNGKLIQQKNNQKTTVHEFTDEIILDGLHNGIYLLNININGEESSFKLIKE